jgi:hypothetical protein
MENHIGELLNLVGRADFSTDLQVQFEAGAGDLWLPIGQFSRHFGHFGAGVDVPLRSQKN